jgi:hypothetical protein
MSVLIISRINAKDFVNFFGNIGETASVSCQINDNLLVNVRLAAFGRLLPKKEAFFQIEEEPLKARGKKFFFLFIDANAATVNV